MQIIQVPLLCRYAWNEFVFQSLQCHDWEGNPVTDGVKYIPKKDDPCMACVCDEGFPVMCTAVLCSPPECRLWEAVEGVCCRFHCIEPDHTPSNKTKGAIVPRNTKSSDVDKTNLGLRLIASTVTSFLILALLVFMVHRLRQRRLLIMMRRMHADQRDEEAVAYMSQFDQLDMGIEFPPYEEPPPPYTPPKPPDIPQGEAPPPYEVTPGEDNNTETNNNGGGGNLPGGRGPRPLQGNGSVFPVASSSMDHVTADGVIRSSYHNQDAPSPMAEDVDSLPISRSAREIQAHSEGLTPPGGGIVGGLHSPSEHSYENLREICTRHLLQRAPSSEAETASAVSTPPGFSPDSDYPAIVAAMTASFHSQGSPVASQVVVRMHNDNPRCHVVRGGQDVMTTSLPTYLSPEPRGAARAAQLMDDSHPWVPSYRTQFIKRSESVEIKRGSNSPRNSFYTDETAAAYSAARGEDGGGGGESQLGSPGESSGSASPQSLSADHHVKKRRPFAANVTWNKSCRPFRIRMDSTSPRSEDAVTGEEGGVGVDGWMDRHHSHSYGITSPSPPSVEQNRHSMPPVDLELPEAVDAMLGASGTRYYKTSAAGDCSGTSSDQSPADERLEVGVSPTGSGQASASKSSSHSPVYSDSACAAAAPNNTPAGVSSTSPSTGSTSPQSPIAPHMVRSCSITSQVSQFSVCSETGEKKRPRPVNITFPRSLRNDVHYPLSPLSSNYAAPMSSVPPVLKARKPQSSPPISSSSSSSSRQPASGSRGHAETQNSPFSSPVEETPPPVEAGMRNLNEDPRTSRHRPCRNKISYVDVSPERSGEKSSSSASTPSSDGSGGYPKQPTASSPMTNDSTMGSVSPLSPDSGTLDNQHCLNGGPISGSHVSPDQDDVECGERRKVKKQHSQRRRSRPKSGGDPSVTVAKGAATATSHSPERHRRLSRNLDTSTTFKQYGFIDDPDVINNARDPTLGHNNGSLPRNLENSCERRDNSGERKHENSRERHSSRERKSSRERHEHSQDRKRGSRNNSCERKRERRERSASRERKHRSRSGEHRDGNRPTTLTNDEDRAAVQTIDNLVLTGDSPTAITTMPSGTGRKRERDYASQAASLERRKKRRSTGDHLLHESSQNNNYPVTQCNSGNSNPTTDGIMADKYPGFPATCANQHNQTDMAPTHRSRRSKHNRMHESRHSMPLIVHRNR